MRALALFAMLGTPAFAEPKQLPDIVKESVDKAKVAPPAGVLGMDGNVSAAVIIGPPKVEPGPGWYIPPDPNDPMVLVPGTNQLPDRKRIEAWLPRDLSRQLLRAADKVWDFVLPKV